MGLNRTYVYKTRPGYFSIFFMLLGAFFMGFLCSLFFKGKWTYGNINEQTGRIIIISLLLFFGTLALTCLAFVIGFRIYYLTNDSVIITKPLLLYKRVISLSDIAKISEIDESIAFAGRPTLTMVFRRQNPPDNVIYQGKKATMILVTGEKIKINSIGIWGYTGLIKKIESLRRIKRGTANFS